MRIRWYLALLLTAALIGVAASAESYAIAKEDLDKKKVYCGDASDFEKPAEVDFKKIVQATPEYKELKRDKIKRGTGKYWILMSKASERAVKAICSVGDDSDYDLIALEGYLGDLEPAIPAEDVTDDVIEQLEEEEG